MEGGGLYAQSATGLLRLVRWALKGRYGILTIMVQAATYARLSQGFFRFMRRKDFTVNFNIF